MPEAPVQALQIALEIDIAAPPEKVWAILGTTAGMQRWLGAKEFVPEVGGAFRLEAKTPEGEFTFLGQVQVCEPRRELAFTWTQHEKGKDPWPVSTLVTIRLAETENGTRVILLHSSFEKLPQAIARAEYEGHITRWERSRALIELKQLVEGLD